MRLQYEINEAFGLNWADFTMILNNDNIELKVHMLEDYSLIAVESHRPTD